MAADDVKALIAAVTPDLLYHMAGERSFDRGEAYFAEEAVQSLRRDGDAIKAVVQGTRRYRVRLWVVDGELAYDCTCPVGQDGYFCKHCVAVGLAWHAAAQSDGDGAIEGADTALGADDVRAYLHGLDREELVSLLMDQADTDERLHRRLTLRAAQATSGTADLSVWKGALDEALETDDYVDYHAAYDYAAGVGDVIESLDDMLRAGQAERVIHLAEYGVAELERSLDHVDDSDGWLSAKLGRLQDIHLEACCLARPDPVDLAERLFEAEVESSFDSFHKAAFVYADVLGEPGLAAYRRMAEAEWAKLPALKPGDDDSSGFAARYAITAIMEAIAEASGDLDALVAIKSRDLSTPYAFLEIAKLYRDAGDAALALDWAERGWRAFSDTRQDERLRAFIADAYQSQGRRDEAMALIWEAFAEYPHLETYRQLAKHGRRAGEWPVWREKALASIRARIAGKTSAPPGRQAWTRSPLHDHSLLVEIFLHEDDVEAAWREAETGGCSDHLWLQLAKRREQSHPEDSARLYKARVASLLRHTGDRVYQEAVGFIGRIETLLAAAGQDAAFKPFVDEIRATHKRKRNLMKLLDQNGW